MAQNYTPAIVEQRQRHPTVEVFVQCRRDGIQFQPGGPKQTVEISTRWVLEVGPKKVANYRDKGG